MSGARLAFRADGRVIEAELAPPDALPFAEALFSDYRAEPVGGPPAIRLVGRDRGWRLHGPADTLDVDTLGDALILFEMTLAEMLLRTLRDRHVLHAGGVRIGGRAVLFTGRGGVGKSTLTAALATAGHPVYGDDVVLVDGGSGRIEPFLRLLKVPEPSRRLLGLPRPGTPLDELWPESSLYHPDGLGSRWAEPAAASTVLFPERIASDASGPGDALGDGTAPAAELVPVAGGPTVHRLLGQLLLEEPGARTFESVVRALEGVRAYDLRYADARRVEEELVDALSTAP